MNTQSHAALCALTQNATFCEPFFVSYAAHESMAVNGSLFPTCGDDVYGKLYLRQ